MSALRDKLRAMASLSEDWNAAPDAPQAQMPQAQTQQAQERAAFTDESTDYAPADGLPGHRLDAFLQIDPTRFFGLNDLPPGGFDPRRVLFLDTETTGLFGAAVQAFLIGLGYFTPSGFRVRQLLLREPDAESQMLEALCGIARDFDVLVTFNGKSFDVPLLQTRLTLCRIRAPLCAAHIDLIHPARRIYRLRIESCSLGNIESRVFSAPRQGDIDGAEIPGRYYRYLRSGDESLLADIVSHNRRDIVTMPLLAAAMCRALDAPQNAGEAADRFSIGRYYLRQRDAQSAQAYFSSVTEGVWSLPAMWQRSLLLKKTDIAQAAQVWEKIVSRTPDYCPALMELSKYHEHTTGDLALAYAYCLRALDTGIGKAKYAQYLARRRDRLEKKRARIGADAHHGRD